MSEATPHERLSTRVQRLATLWILLILLGFLVLLGRVVQLKVAPDDRLHVAAGSPYSTRPELARRGDILDRRGRRMATSYFGYRLFVDPLMVDDLRTIAVRIAHEIDGDPIEFDRKIIDHEESRYVVMDHLLDDWQVEAIREADLPGVGLEPRLVRSYPSGEIGALVLGKVGFEHRGQGGSEHRFDKPLQERDGRVTYLHDARGGPLWVEPSDYIERADGENVRLSIDIVIQDIAEQRLREVVQKHNAGGGRLIVLDVKSGEILAMCDVLNPRPGWDEVTDDPGRLLHPALGRNRCATDPFEPGSTFKPFIWSVATELGLATPQEILPLPSGGPHRTSQGRRIREAKYYGPMSWERVLIKSQNSGMAIVGERLSERELRDAVLRFGFGTRSGARLPGESPGLVTSRKNWNHYTQTSVPMGQEVAVTPLQMVRAFSAFARDGTLVSLRMTATQANDLPLEIVHQAITRESALLTRSVLRKVMLEGTGRKAQSEMYRIFGKSGTPQLPKKEGGGYHEDRYVPNFIAGAPLDDPRIIVYCVLDDPDKTKGYHGGGATAGPVVRDVIDATLMYLGVAPDISDDDPPLSP